MPLYASNSTATTEACAKENSGWSNIAGISAGVITAVANSPFVYRVYSTKDASPIFLPTVSLFTVASLIWAGYSVMKSDVFMLATNVFLFASNVALIAATYLYPVNGDYTAL